MSFPRATTPTLTLVLPQSYDLSEAAHVYVTVSAVGCEITKKDDELTIDANEIDVTLSQAETLRFAGGKAFVQVNWVYNDGSRWATEIAELNIDRQLIPRVLP